MNTYIFIAACLLFLLGTIHSILGERLIFKNLRNSGNLIPTKSNDFLKEAHIRIVWATWHLASILSWCFAAVLLKIAFTENEEGSTFAAFFVQSIAYTSLIAALLVAIATKRKHPGWVVLAIIALILWMA